MIDLVGFCPKCGSELPWMGAGHCEACNWSEDDLNAVQIEDNKPASPSDFIVIEGEEVRRPFRKPPPIVLRIITTYIVTRYDTLASICSRFDSSIQDLALANPDIPFEARGGPMVYPGESLKIARREYAGGPGDE